MSGIIEIGERESGLIKLWLDATKPRPKPDDEWMAATYKEFLDYVVKNFSFKDIEPYAWAVRFVANAFGKHTVDVISDVEDAR
jgi:hypothetical protein